MCKSLTLISTVLALLAVVFVAAACGLGGTTATTGATARTTRTATATPDPAAGVALNASKGDSADGLDLTIVGETSSSPGQPYPSLGISCGPALVYRASNPTTTTYSAADLQAIRAYVTNVPLTRNGFAIPDGQAPSTLRWVSTGPACGARFDIHNGASPGGNGRRRRAEVRRRPRGERLPLCAARPL